MMFHGPSQKQKKEHGWFLVSDKRAVLYLYKKWPAPSIDTRYTREVTDSELTYRPTSPRLNYHLHGEEPSLMSYCGGDGVCISSTACDWDLIVQDDADCIKEHKDFVCCTATTVHVPENVFKAYDWWS
ncbi:unnamed protein product [Spodoptera exigua]|nr:unnamed protein product [Spodoptera exigua]